MERNYMYDKLKGHIGHDVICAAYGDLDNPVDITIECVDCGMILISAEDYDEETLQKEEKISYYIGTDGSSGMKFESKQEFLAEISKMIDDCIANGGTKFDITVDADASCFYQETEEK